MCFVLLLYATIGLMAGCSFRDSRFEEKLLYKNNSFNRSSFSGSTLMVLPLITDEGFFKDTLELTPLKIAGWLRKNRSSLKCVFKESFERTYKTKFDSISLANFYKALFKQNIIALQTSDSVWTTINADYMLIVRIVKGIKIQRLSGKQIRQAILEAEVWSIKKQGCVWRMSIRADDASVEEPDTVFMWKLVERLLNNLPTQVVVNKEEQW